MSDSLMSLPDLSAKPSVSSLNFNRLPWMKSPNIPSCTGMCISTIDRIETDLVSLSCYCGAELNDFDFMLLSEDLQPPQKDGSSTTENGLEFLSLKVTRLSSASESILILLASKGDISRSSSIGRTLIDEDWEPVDTLNRFSVCLTS